MQRFNQSTFNALSSYNNRIFFYLIRTGQGKIRYFYNFITTERKLKQLMFFHRYFKSDSASNLQAVKRFTSNKL